ncbi:MAG: cytochrome d ubiquinol oxidase subunit II, partial [Pseudomonadota bacterium]
MELMGFPAETWLPFVFIVLMGVSMLAYVVLDGFDLGVGMLTAVAASEDDRDRMVASIGPFWDANETWLVLGVGILLVAFPAAHGVILTALYLPVALMLLGLILRGVAFEFRAKVAPNRKQIWNIAFFVGSLITALAQGYMLGLFIMGLESTWATNAFG